MHRRTARGNRLGLALSGLLLMLAGVALFGAHEGWFGADVARTPVYPASARRFVHHNGSWLWTVVAIVAVLIGLIFLRWLLVQPRVDRLTRLRIDTEGSNADGADDEGAGRTQMPAGAISDIVEDDILALRGVRRASATISGRIDAPELWLRVTTNADADVGRIRQAIVSEIVRDARACLDIGSLPTYLALIVTRRDSPREVH